MNNAEHNFNAQSIVEMVVRNLVHFTTNDVLHKPFRRYMQADIRLSAYNESQNPRTMKLTALDAHQFDEMIKESLIKALVHEIMEVAI